MKVKDPERTLYMYMSDRLKSRAWGVHVRAGLDLTTLCGMKFDDNGTHSIRKRILGEM